MQPRQCPAMGKANHPPEDPHEPSAGTLGAVIYADKTSPRVSEGEWLALVEAIAARDLQALHALYDRTHRMVFTLIMRIVASRETAEELTLDVFHDVWRRASTYDPANGSVIGWVMNQARSRAIDRLRFEQRKKRVDPHAHDAAEGTTEHGPYESLEAQQRTRALRTALNGLAPLEREAIESAFFAELSYAEVAERLDAPLGTIKTRIRSGLEKLRKLLPGEGEA